MGHPQNNAALRGGNRLFYMWPEQHGSHLQTETLRLPDNCLAVEFCQVAPVFMRTCGVNCTTWRNLTRSDAKINNVY